jgi:hypothetical protein
MCGVRWEARCMTVQYKVIRSAAKDLEEELNAAAGEGYELVAALANHDGSVTAIMDIENAGEDDEDYDDEEEDEEEPAEA